MKPCVCGGSNNNCRYCSGSGYVPDNVGLPQIRSKQETWGAGSEPLREPRSEEKLRVETKSPSSFFSETKGCLWWGLVVPILFALLVGLLMGKF
jgi:hypothetical protein